MSSTPTLKAAVKHAPCTCLLPYYGPNYWDWQCRACSGRIVGLIGRLKARRARRKEAP